MLVLLKETALGQWEVLRVLDRPGDLYTVLRRLELFVSDDLPEPGRYGVSQLDISVMFDVPEGGLDTAALAQIASAVENPNPAGGSR